MHHPHLSADERDAPRDGRAHRCRARSRRALPLSARIFRRPAPAHRTGARAGAGADLHRARRADQRARHADPVADGRSAARPAEEARSHLHVHLARPARGGGAGEPACWCCATARWWRRAQRPICSRIRRATTRARCLPPPSIWKPRRKAWWRNDARGRNRHCIACLASARPCRAIRHGAIRHQGRRRRSDRQLLL